MKWLRSAFDEMWRFLFALILVITFLFLVYKTLVAGLQEQKIVFLNGKINSEVRIKQKGRLYSEEVGYWVGYYVLEDGGIKQFSMPKESTVIYYDLKEEEQCYAEYRVGIFGIRIGEIRLHLHTVQNPISVN